ncbi:Plant self-incompatibility S1 [Arabidopsis thaliana x Arabidopsis arenosa]|nr:Plant self-incompatibility S1 [Arabidopsis thaliana x Arabidopsis arenosa]
MYSGLIEACKKDRVEIHNQLGPGSILTFRCQSNENNLGINQLNFNAAPYIIQFHERVGGGTRWNCHFMYGNETKYVQDIVVYEGTTFFPRCGQLRSWAAKFDGIYMTKKANQPYDKVVRWD